MYIYIYIYIYKGFSKRQHSPHGEACQGRTMDDEEDWGNWILGSQKWGVPLNHESGWWSRCDFAKKSQNTVFLEYLNVFYVPEEAGN